MNEQPPKPRRGCFFYGCITGLVLLVLLLVALLLGIHYGMKKVSVLVNEYTDTTPMTLPTVQMAQADIDKLKQRWQAFEEAVRTQRPVAPLVLTADEINALIASGPDKQLMKGKFYVRLDENRVKAELSLPLQGLLTWKMVKGRYLNGSGTFNVSLQNGVLFVAPQTIEVKGKPVPEMYMQGMRKQNFAQGFANEPNATAVLQGLQDIQVKDGKLIIVPKEKPEAAGVTPERQSP
jgi:hypothetical protein